MSMTETDTATSKITHSVVMVDSTIALRWLQQNVKNRPIRQMIVHRYRSDMEAGRWSMAGDPIRFDVNGHLIDGQHRLTALSEIDGLTLPMLVIRNLPTESQGVMDQGAKRTPADQLGIAGVRNGSYIAAAVKKFIVWESGLLFRDNKAASAITAPRIEGWVQEHPTDVEHLQDVMTVAKNNDAPPSAAGAAAIAFGRIDPEQSNTFFELLAHGAGTEGHPIVTLDKRLQRNRREGIKMSDRDYLALFILAWNAWRDDRRMTKFQRPRGGKYTEDNFPEPR